MSFLFSQLANKRRAYLATRLTAISFTVVAPVAAAAASIVAQPVQFTLLPMTGTEIRNELLGTKLNGEYSSGRRWSEQLNSNFTSLYEENGSTLSGQLSVAGNQICFSYLSSEGGENDVDKGGGSGMGGLSINGVGGCFEVWKRSANCYDFYSATSPPPLRVRRFARSWLARAWRASDEPTCQSTPVS